MNRRHLAALAATVALASILAASVLAARSPTTVQAGSAPAFSAAVQRQFQ
jgi:hypothetical protein